MLSPSQQATLNVEEARALRASGCTYRQIARQLGLSSAQLGHVRRTLSREKAAGTRLLRTMPNATARDFPVNQSILPWGLRRQLTSAGYRTLGDVAERLRDPNLPGLEAMPGVGPHKAALVKRLLDHHGLLPGNDDLRGAIEKLFPDLADPSGN
jgi:transposase-like protein